MAHTVSIRSKEFLTPDVLRIITDKPEDIHYKPGQAADIAINKEDWKNEIRPFTFASLEDEDYIEFNIKTYPSHHGVTEQLLHLNPGDELIIGDVFGAIEYKGEGVFIAGGAGVTPFIAIFRFLEKNGKIGHNKLIFANKKKEDIILEKKFKTLLKNNFINILSEEELDGYEHGLINEDLIRKHKDGNTKYIYLCGPEPMMDAVEKQLDSIGISRDYLVREAF